MFSPLMINLTLCQTNGTQGVTEYYSMLAPKNLNPLVDLGSTLCHLHDKEKRKMYSSQITLLALFLLMFYSILRF